MSSHCISLMALPLALLIILPLISAGVSASAGGDAAVLPECHAMPKVLCCTDRVLDKCLSGCIDYVAKKCPQKLDNFETIGAKNNNNINKIEEKSNSFAEARAEEKFVDRSERRRAPTGGDAKMLSKEFPITEVSDADLTSECGTERSRPPYSPCLSRKTVDDVFANCCKQHVPSNCHSLCSYEHREHVAAETLIAAVQQDGCDLKYLSNVLYCANQKTRDGSPRRSGPRIHAHLVNAAWKPTSANNNRTNFALAA